MPAVILPGAQAVSRPEDSASPSAVAASRQDTDTGSYMVCAATASALAEAGSG